MEEENPWEEGWSAGYDDLPPENPYQEGTEEYDLWEEGYDQGSEDC